MATTNFQLQPALEGFIERLKSKGGFTPEDLDELKSHLVDSIQDLQAKGLSVEEAFLVSSCRIGNENELSGEYQKVNGSVFAKPQFFYIITGMSLFLLLFQLWNIFSKLTMFISLQLEGFEVTVFLIGLFFSMLIILFYYHILNSKNLMQVLERKFYRNQMVFSIKYLSTVILFSVLLVYLGGVLDKNIYEFRNSNHGVFPITAYSSYAEINFWIVPASILLISLFFLLRRNDEKLYFRALINEAGLLVFISMGVLWETIAAYSRFITRGMEQMSSAIIYAVVFSSIIFFLAKYLENKAIQKIIAFSAFAIIIELTGVFLNPLLVTSAFFSIYFYFLIAGIALAWLGGRYFFKIHHLGEFKDSHT